MLSAVLLIVMVALMVSTNAFVLPSSVRHHQRLAPSMMFGGGKKTATAAKIVIKADGKTIESSEKTVNLRKELQKNKIDVYPLRAKLTGNCGGAGICGTCAVKVLDGMNNLNPPSKNEQNTLKGKPTDFRLSCCARVSGPITIKTKP